MGAKHAVWAPILDSMQQNRRPLQRVKVLCLLEPQQGGRPAIYQKPHVGIEAHMVNRHSAVSSFNDDDHCLLARR